MMAWIAEKLSGQWQRQVIAVVAAVLIWITVNDSITMTKSFVSVPVKVNNTPPDLTVVGQLPGGILSQRMNLTLTGSKKVLAELDSGDLEVRVDATGKPDEWAVNLSPKSIFNVTTGESLAADLTAVEHSDLILRMSPLITARVRVRVLPPIGEPPEGYQYLDVWPPTLLHTITGPEEQVEELQEKELQLIFDLGDISKEELDMLEPTDPELEVNEVNFLVPSKWKRVAIPFHNNALEEINDLDADKLRIEFLREELLPIDTQIPVQVFYPPRYSNQLNPELNTLAESEFITTENGIQVLQIQLAMKNVSRLFLDVVRDNLQLVILAQPEGATQRLPWSVQVLDANRLKETYVNLLAPIQPRESDPAGPPQHQQQVLQDRFWEYLRRFQLVKPNGEALELEVVLEDNAIRIQET